MKPTDTNKSFRLSLFFLLNKNKNSKDNENKKNENLLFNPEKDKNLEKKKAYRSRFLDCILVSGGLFIAFSLRFSGSAHAVTSVPPANRVIPSYQVHLTSSSQDLDLNPFSISGLNKLPLQDRLALKKTKGAPSNLNLRSSQSSNIFGTKIEGDFQMLSQGTNKKYGEARSSFGPIETNSKDILDFVIKDKNEQDLERNNLKTNEPEVIDAFAQDVLRKARNNMMNFNLPPCEEIPEIIHAINRFDFALMKKKMFFQTFQQDGFHSITMKNEVNEKELDVFRQKTRVLCYLLETPFKQNNSIIKKVGHFIDQEVLSIFQDKEIDPWSAWYRNQYRKATNYIKLVAADGLEAVSDQFYNYPLCPLPFDVVIELSSYLEKMHTIVTDQIFIPYWINRYTKDLTKFRCTPYVQLKSPNGPRSIDSLVDAALVDAVHLVMGESLIDHYNSKHKTDYKVEYIKRTGIEPRLPRNRMSQIQRETQYLLATASPIIDPDASKNEGFL